MQYESQIIQYVVEHPASSSTEIFDGLGLEVSSVTLRREISRLVKESSIVVNGKGKSSRYSVSPAYKLLLPLNIDTYFEREIDERVIRDSYNFDLIEVLQSTPVFFSIDELDVLNALQAKFSENIEGLSESGRKSELDRLAVDLSWKSSQIEGNTYSLLETERLLMEKETAQGKNKDEAVMLLNHKDAIDFILDNPDYLSSISLAKIETIHSILIKELDVDRNIRIRRVGITGTNYRPLDNEFQIREALEQTCELINARDNIFEKALLLLLMISYIQPFSDGNKRTARIVSNAILIANGYCPLSFRSVDSIDYKKAMLAFYEQNNIYAFKQIFIEQFRFAVKTYF